MLDFNFESPTRVSVVAVIQTPRAPVDRRGSTATDRRAPAPQFKRRRHDGLYSGKPVPLQW
jgi:hypothetical protein